MTLSFVTDRKRYDLDDTIMITARFTYLDNMKAKVQFTDCGCGSQYFFLVSEPVGHRANIVCQPIPELQFISPEGQKELYRDGGWSKWTREVSGSLGYQLAVHLPRKGGLPVGVYKYRVGYTVARKDDLVTLVKAATGEKLDIDGGPLQLLKGAWDGALLSEPVTITIGPNKDKK